MSDARISMVTLGVDDLERALTFYEKLGWKNTSHSQESVKFLEGGNIVLGLYGREALAKDAGTKVEHRGFSGTSLAVNLESESAVDMFYRLATNAGAHPQKPPEKAFWGGYSGYFRDLDGYYWEIAHNPFFPLDSSGNLDLGAQ